MSRTAVDRRVDRSMISRFGVYIAVVGLVGFGLAIWADATDVDGGYRDAAREMGGAIVSGAVLAGLVVWFEDRREDQREETAEQRADTAAAEAWKREVDIRLLTVVRTDLMLARLWWRYEYSNPGRPFGECIAEVSALLDVQEHDDLTEAWNKWLEFINFDASDGHHGPSERVDDDPQWEAFNAELTAYLDRSYR